MDIETDVCIVGSGASGAIMAKELAVAGFQVAVVEKGDWLVRDELAEDELLWKMRLAHQPEEERSPTWFGEERAGPFHRAPVGPAFCLVGGGTVLYAGASWRLREADFKKRSRYGPMSGVSLADWPIDYSDLEPYYTRAEEELGISGVAGEDPTEPPRSRDVLDPPIDLDDFSESLMRSGAAMGLKPFHLPLAIRSEDDPESGTLGCQKGGWCSGYPCQFGSKSSVDVRILPRALATGRCKVLARTAALKVEVDKRGLCSGVLCQHAGTGNRLLSRRRAHHQARGNG